MKKRWIVSPPDRELQGLLGRELKISHLTAQLLINRGLVDVDKASSFLSPFLRNLHNPFLMKGMDRAVERILQGIRDRQKITIYGDYDVDGVTSTALLHLFFREIGFAADYHIPQRLKDGYGLNNSALRHLSDSGTRLVITTDCGISNYEEVAFANSLGLDVIITDHHEPPEKLPPAYAILNPKQHDCAFPFKELAGVGVAFNLIIALRSKLRDRGHLADNIPNLRGYTDIVALGTVADMVPLIDENRIFVKYGLEELTTAARPGIRALKEVSRVNSTVKAGTVGFQLAPRINAAGRLADASAGVRLLITHDDREALNIARELDRENLDRQRLEREIFLEAIEAIESEAFDLDKKRAIVLAKEEWHPGVIGVVASKLVERYGRPVIVISLKSGVGKGSARGIKNFHMLDGLKELEGFLQRYGGHKMAAGITIQEEDIHSFKTAFYDLAEKKLSIEDIVPEINIDSYVSLRDLNEKAVNEIECIAPFGLANPEPILATRDAGIVESEVVGNNHLRLRIREMNLMRDGIAYGMGGVHPLKGNFDIAFTPYIDEWNGSRNLKLKVKEINGL